MAPKKRRTKKQLNHGGIIRDETQPPEVINALSFDHTEDARLGGKTWTYTWTGLKDHLKHWKDVQKKYENTEEAQRDFLDQAAAEDDLTNARETWENAKLQEAEVATPAADMTLANHIDAVTIAKAAYERVAGRVKRYRMMKKDRRFDRTNRSVDHEQLSNAQHRLEDFLYYQDSIRRWQRFRDIDPDERASREADSLKRRMAYKIGDNAGHYRWLHDLLNYYDARGIGNPEYKEGRRDGLGNPRKTNDNSDEQAHTQWGELHLWTPRLRRWPSGLPQRIRLDANGVGRMINGVEQFEYYTTYEPGEKLEPVKMNLNLRDIEEKRAEIEDIKLEDRSTEGLQYGTHTERRQQELLRYGPDRPNTSALHNGRAFEDRWDKMRTEQGLFIAAKESSWDWLTSYDCLDRVRSGGVSAVHPMSAVREEPLPNSDSDDDTIWRRDYPYNDDMDLHNIPVRQRGNAKRRSTVKDKKRTPEVGSIDNRDEKLTAKDNIHAWKKRKANIDYPYPRNEFTKQKSRVEEGVDEEEKVSITNWAEETDGRREWHTYQGISPSSDVESPPRSPILNGVVEEKDPHSIPQFGETDGMWQVLPGSEMPLPEKSKTRCKINENCRAWWPHLGKECWVAHSEIMERPVDSSDTSLTVNLPLVLSVEGVDTYRERLYDHHGLRQPQAQQAQWPKLGTRVPYEPMTFDDMKLKSPENIEIGTYGDVISIETRQDMAHPHESSKDTRGDMAKDTVSRAAYGVYSLAVPIIKTPQRDWGVVAGEPLPTVGSQVGRGEDEESDDEGDLFRISYEEGSHHSAV
jgi:hypothetical protein